MREIYWLRVFSKRALRKMFELKREEIAGGLMELHNERLRDL
jgi:hypothetical protein